MDFSNWLMLFAKMANLHQPVQSWAIEIAKVCLWTAANLRDQTNPQVIFNRMDGLPGNPGYVLNQKDIGFIHREPLSTLYSESKLP